MYLLLPAGTRRIPSVRLYVTVILATLPAVALAQPGSEPRVELVTGVRYDAFEGVDLQQVLVEYWRSPSLDQLLTDPNAIGRVWILRLGAGVRFRELDDRVLRWRAALVDLDMIRPPFGLGLTLFDYDRSGSFDLDARWFAIRFGPGVRIGQGAVYLGLRAVGTIGWSTWRPGGELYGEQGDSAHDRRRAYVGGYRGDGIVQIGPWLSLTAAYQFNTPLADARLHRVRIYGGMAITLAERFELYGRYTFESLHLDEGDADRDFFTGGLRLIL